MNVRPEPACDYLQDLKQRNAWCIDVICETAKRQRPYDLWRLAVSQTSLRDLPVLHALMRNSIPSSRLSQRWRLSLTLARLCPATSVLATPAGYR
jgi:hypothetical protein